MTMLTTNLGQTAGTLTASSAAPSTDITTSWARFRRPWSGTIISQLWSSRNDRGQLA